MTSQIARASGRPTAPTVPLRPRDLPDEDRETGVLGVVTVLIGVLLAMVDFFIVNVALPTIDTDLHAGPAMLELVVAAYGIAYALLLVLGGRLGDAFGRRRLFLAGMAAFGLTSLACGLAPTAGVLVAARTAQGAAAAMMVPQVLSTIQATTSGQNLSRALGLYAATGGIASIAGQLIGGALISADIAGSGWRAIFLVNVPVVIAGLVLSVKMVPETRSPNPARADGPGTALLGITVLALLVPLMIGRTIGWPVWTWVLLAAVPFGLGVFTAVERRSERAGAVPLVPPSLLRVRSMRVGLVLAVAFFSGFGGFMFVYGVALQQGVHLGPLEAGLAVVPMGLGFFFASLSTTRLVARFGRNVITAGAALQALGLAGLILEILADWPHLTPLNLAPAAVVVGVGQGLLMSPLLRVILSEVPIERAGTGSGVFVTVQQISLALGVATLGSLFLSLSGARGPGFRDAMVTVLAIQIGLALLVIAVGRLLPGRTAGGDGD